MGAVHAVFTLQKQSEKLETCKFLEYYTELSIIENTQRLKLNSASNWFCEQIEK